LAALSLASCVTDLWLAVMLKWFWLCDAIPCYVKMSYAILCYVILISLLRQCGDIVIQPPNNIVSLMIMPPPATLTHTPTTPPYTLHPTPPPTQNQ